MITFKVPASLGKELQDYTGMHIIEHWKINVPFRGAHMDGDTWSLKVHLCGSLKVHQRTWRGGGAMLASFCPPLPKAKCPHSLLPGLTALLWELFPLAGDCIQENTVELPPFQGSENHGQGSFGNILKYCVQSPRSNWRWRSLPSAATPTPPPQPGIFSRQVPEAGNRSHLRGWGPAPRPWKEGATKIGFNSHPLPPASRGSLQVLRKQRTQRVCYLSVWSAQAQSESWAFTPT